MSADFKAASAPSIKAMKPLVSIIPIACLAIMVVG